MTTESGEVAGVARACIPGRFESTGTDAFDPSFDLSFKPVPRAGLVPDLVPAATVRVQIVNGESHRRETEPLGGQRVQAKLILVYFRWRAVRSRLEIDELHSRGRFTLRAQQ